MSVHSMTGFARVRKSSEAGEAVVSVKSVNHRGLDMHFHMPSVLDVFENEMRSAVKRSAVRGHFQIHVAFSPAGAAAPVIVNRPLLDSYISAFRAVATERGIGGEPDLNTALSVPGMLREMDDAEPDENVRSLLLSALEEALGALNGFREREGREIAADLLARAAAVRGRAARMEEIRGDALAAFQSRLTERLGELLQGVNLEPQRIVQEAAVLADRSDIGEELARLKIHAGQVEDLLRGGGEIGKKLDFLLQEMNREANTVLSKTGGIGELGLGITELALAAKSDIEKIREQSLNLE